MRNKISIILIFTFIFFSTSASAIAEIKTWNCSGKIIHKSDEPVWDKIIKDFKIIVFGDKKHLIGLAPLSDKTTIVETNNIKVEVPKILLDEFEIQNDSVPVRTGKIEIVEKFEDSKIRNEYKLIVVQKSPKILVGLILENGRLYSLRIDKQKENWSFIFYDTSKLETVNGACDCDL